MKDTNSFIPQTVFDNLRKEKRREIKRDKEGRRDPDPGPSGLRYISRLNFKKVRTKYPIKSQ